MANRLAGATSPYLLQHKDNPVDWWEWSAEAFAEAERRDVPVLISVGYAACHWCHVMAHETQIDPTSRWFTVPRDMQREIWPTEDYELVRSLVDTELPEDDLFAGIDARVGGMRR